MTMTETHPAELNASAQSVELTPDMLYSIASLTVAASKGDFTPVLESVRFAVEDGNVSAVATDRYRIARVTFPALAEDTHNQPADWNIEPITVPRDLLERFAKALKASKPGSYARITITVEPGATEHDAAKITLSEPFSGLTMTDREVKGNYPPIERLMPGGSSWGEFAPVDMVHVNMAYLADAAKISHPAIDTRTRKGQTPPMTIRATGEYDTGKAKPILVTRAIPDGQGTLEYLLQPNMRA